ncbi:MAG: group III truncated hemoglobin [Chitinophagales bacterium]
MKQDISTRQDIDTLVKLFYDKLLQDEILQTIFRETVLSHLEKHLTIIANFWDSILLDADVYRGNVTEKHIALDQRFPLNEKEFNQWLFLWKQTIDELFAGEKAEMAKFRAQSIADIMRYKIDFLNKNKS